MTAGRDDDALMWEGDDDPTLDAGSVRPGFDDMPLDAAAPPVLPAGWTAVGAGAVGDTADQSDAATPVAAETPTLGNAALISLGVFGGVFVLYAIGWYLGATRLAAFQLESGLGTLLGMPMLADDFMYLVWVALVTLAPPIWFLVTILLTQGSRFWKRFVGLLSGVVLLVPWPFLMIGGAVAI